MQSFIRFNLDPPQKDRKTSTWQVLTIDGRHYLGSVSWYAPWRRYCYNPAPVVLDFACLNVLAHFCEEKTKERRTERAAEKIGAAS